MSVGIVTGSGGLIGSETVRFLHSQGLDVVGIDNNLRSYFFGKSASTEWKTKELTSTLRRYTHINGDIRDYQLLRSTFRSYAKRIQIIVHCAAQPSHDWAAREPITDFSVNSLGTLYLLECLRTFAPEATFIFTSTNKVYGDTPNRLPLVELETRWECDPSHPFSTHGIDESMSIDHSTHSVFGASKVSADIMVQEYGSYFGLKTGVFRGGCLTGPAHSGAELHGFLAYLVRAQLTGRSYTVYGYKGKQVRDNIHSRDLVNAFWHYHQRPCKGEVYNIGGSRHSNCSILEAARIVERLTGKPLNVDNFSEPRIGDHTWWISDVRKFQNHFPEWRYSYDIESIIAEIVEAAKEREELKMKLSVLMPARNEEECIGSTVAAVTDALSIESIPHEVIVVDDNSSDRTPMVVEEMMANNPVIRLIHNSPPNGYGLAVRKGLESCTGDVVAVFMADASDNPGDLIQFYKKLGQGFDCVFGTRWSKGGKAHDYPVIKHVLNRLANNFIRILAGISYDDMTNAFKMYRREVIDGIQPLISNHFNLTVEMPLKAVIRGYSYAVVPNSWANRKTGIAKLQIREMGSRYLFILLYCLLEKWLSRKDYFRNSDHNPFKSDGDINLASK